jgi:hypothetical protein
MSSGGAVVPVDTANYLVSQVRDSSDWTLRMRQMREYKNYRSSGSQNKDTEPVWIKRGNAFRLSWMSGRWKCADPECHTSYAGNGVP